MKEFDSSLHGVRFEENVKKKKKKKKKEGLLITATCLLADIQKTVC